jgi:RHS repeat-associated protein
MKGEDGVTTYYVGGIYELSEGVRTSYYYVSGQRTAMRRNGTLTYLHGDHLGSTSLATSDQGGEVYRRGYYPFGEERYAVGVAVTDYGFTGQREEAGFGLYDYDARYYDPYLNRFPSPDTIVPNPANPQSLNRFSYVYNNPLKYTDPDGHFAFLALLAVGVVGGLIGGAIYGYGHQVAENLDEGMELGEALTTNIDPVEVGGLTGVGGVIGGLVGGGLWVAEQLATAAGMKLTEWVIRHPRIAKLLGIPTAVVMGELSDADNDEQVLLEQAGEAGRRVLDSVTRDQARDALRSGIEGVTPEQAAKAVQHPTNGGAMQSVSMSVLENGTLEIAAQRAGYEGYQVFTWVVDSGGNTVGVYQATYTAQGILDHLHDKLNNVVLYDAPN